MNIQLESYAQEILNENHSNPIPTRRNQRNLHIIKSDSGDVFHQNIAIGGRGDQESVKKPIQKTEEEMEEMFGNIIESECILVDKKSNGSYYSLTPVSIELIKFCNNRILKNKKKLQLLMLNVILI